MSNAPTKPLAEYPVADLGDVPQPPAPDGGATPAAKSAPQPLAEAAVLEFLDPAAISAEVPLQFGFKHEGREVTCLTVRRLNGAEVGRISNERGREVELFDFYEAMSRTPKAVLRGMIDDDLEAFLDKARPFLCPFARDVFFYPIGETGAPSLDAPAAPSESPGPAS